MGGKKNPAKEQAAAAKQAAKDQASAAKDDAKWERGAKDNSKKCVMTASLGVGIY